MIRNQTAEFIAKQAALFQYIALAKVIENSEAADVRYWSILPGNIRMSHFNLREGQYKVVVEGYTVDGNKLVNKIEKDIVVEKNTPVILHL